MTGPTDNGAPAPDPAEAVDWDDEDLWDGLDEQFGVRNLEPVLRAYTAHLLTLGWRPPPQ